MGGFRLGDHRYVGLRRLHIAAAGEHLVRCGHRRPVIKEFFLLLSEERVGSGFPPHQRPLVHRDVDGRPAAPVPGGNSGPGALLPRLPAPAGSVLRLLRLFILLVLRTAADEVHHVGQCHIGRPHGQHRHGQREDHPCADGTEGCRQAQGQHTAQYAAALHALSLSPELFDQFRRPGVLSPGQQDVEHPAQQHRQKQGAAHPQRHRAAPVEGQDEGGSQQHGRQQIKAIAHQALCQAAEPVVEKALVLDAAQHRKYRQQQADQRPHAPADRLGLRGLLPPIPAGTAALGGLAPAAAAALFGAGAGGGGPFPACGLLLCSGHGISSFLNKQGMDEPCLAQRLLLWNRLFYRVISGTMIPAIREPRPTTQQ